MNRQPIILIVEENLHDLQLLNAHLKALNFSCICTKEGVKGAILAQTHQPDLILLDMMLSDLGANQIIAYLKQEPKTSKIPIVGVIPLILAETRSCIRIVGTEDCISKPYDFLHLEVVISRYISRLNS